ncbi:MAG: hypothetical protein EHM93_02750 [Bacteroidales bacterium]|nr:MAG: hypothetical protein EHM93_02750 [Bacteroidales bacterium]
MREFSIVSVSLLNLFITSRYCWLLYKGKIKPALAMWVFFSFAVGMSLITYLAKDNFSLWDNILNTTDLILVVTISIAIAIWGDKSSKFTKFDTGCLIAVIIAILFWAITQNHLITNLSIQLIMVVSYFPVIRRLFQSKENTEPFSVWILMMLVPLFSLISSKGLLATIYSVRAIVCVGLLLLLMLRIEMVRKRAMRQ